MEALKQEEIKAEIAQEVKVKTAEEIKAELEEIEKATDKDFADYIAEGCKKFNRNLGVNNQIIITRPK